MNHKNALQEFTLYIVLLLPIFIENYDRWNLIRISRISELIIYELH